MARLDPLPPDDLDEAARRLHDDMAAAMQQNQEGVQAVAQDGALLGPFVPMLHFPQFGRGAWDFSKLFMASHTLREPVRQVAILVVASHMRARFEIYSHEIVARDSGLSAPQIAALAAAGRPSDLDQEQEIAYLASLALVEGRQLPDSTYQAAISAFGEAGTAELVFLVGSYVLLSIIINGYDAGGGISLAGRDDQSVGVLLGADHHERPAVQLASGPGTVDEPPEPADRLLRLPRIAVIDPQLPAAPAFGVIQNLDNRNYPDCPVLPTLVGAVGVCLLVGVFGGGVDRDKPKLASYLVSPTELRAGHGTV